MLVRRIVCFQQTGSACTHRLIQALPRSCLVLQSVCSSWYVTATWVSSHIGDSHTEWWMTHTLSDGRLTHRVMGDSHTKWWVTHAPSDGWLTHWVMGRYRDPIQHLTLILSGQNSQYSNTNTSVSIHQHQSISINTSLAIFHHWHLLRNQLYINISMR